MRIGDAASAPITQAHPLHTGAAYAPYPFANSLDEDIVLNEMIEISSSYGS
jgi:hypothetical protein